MKTLSISRRFTAVGLLVLAGCSGEGAAESALAAADAAIGSVQAEAAMVAPDRLAALTTAVATAGELIAAGSFAEATTAAAAIPAQVEQLQADLPGLREELTQEWETLGIAMQRNLEDVQAKLEQYSGGQLPPGATPEQMEAARATHLAVPEAWGSAESAWKAGDLAGAMEQGFALRARVAEAMTTVGLVSDESAWGNARPVRPTP